MKIVRAVAVVILILMASYLVVFGRAFRQDENHPGIALALPRAILSNEAVRVDANTYLARNSESFIRAMTHQVYTYADQMGSG
jgi:hypothetical protein